MCGIVGLFLKNKNLEPALGDMLSKMLVTMSARGPDSAGVAIYGSNHGDKLKLTLRAQDVSSIADFTQDISELLHDPQVSIRSNHIVLSVPGAQEQAVLQWLK